MNYTTKYTPKHYTFPMDDKEKVYEPLLDIESILPILNKISIFGGLDESELYILFQNLRKVRFKKDEMIFRQGDPARHIYIIKEGRVKLYVEENQIPLELIEFGVGNCIGETSLIGIQPHSANVIALEDTEMLVLSGQALHKFYETDLKLFSKIIMNIARETCRRLSQTDNTLMHYIVEKEIKAN